MNQPDALGRDKPVSYHSQHASPERPGGGQDRAVDSAARLYAASEQRFRRERFEQAMRRAAEKD